MQLVTPRAVAMAVRIEMAVWMTKRHTCLFFSSMIFLSFKGLTNEVFSLISLTMLGHAKKTADTTFTIFYNQVCFVHSISSMSLGWVKKTTKTTFTTSNNASPGHCLFEALANQGLLVAKQHFTTLRLAHNLTHFLHSIVRLAMCPREAIPFHGTLSRHGITWASSVLLMAYRKSCYLL